MRIGSVCAECGKSDFEFVPDTHFEKCFCHNCGKETKVVDTLVESPYERRRNAVYATGNRWTIANWEATHN